MDKRFSWHAAVYFCGSLLLSASQQVRAQQGDPATLRVTTRLVVLDVVVVDRQGKPVDGLTRSQFTVTEDKAPQTIRNFDPPAGHGMPAGSAGKLLVDSAADLPKIGNAPVNVLVFDEVNTPFLQLAQARQMMEKYLKAQPEVLPVPTLFVAAGATRMVVLHDYTQSRAELLASVKTHTSDLDFTTLTNTLNGVQTGAENGMVKTLGALSQIAASVRGVPGRKNVIWVGTGYRKAADLQQMTSADRDKVLAAVQTLTDRMLAARVTLYEIDPEGVATTDAGDPSQADNIDAGAADMQLGFDSFAPATGGRVIGGRNDLDAQVAQVSAEGEDYYTLAYVPTSASDAARTYRQIRVTVNDPALRVITRKGYYGGEAPVSQVALAAKAKQPADVKFDLLNAARTTLSYTGLHLEGKPAKNGFALLVSARDLQFVDQPDGGRLATVTVVAVCYNAKGKETSQHAAQLKVRLEAADQITASSKVGMDFPMVVPAFTDRVRVVMRDAGTGVLGSANLKP